MSAEAWATIVIGLATLGLSVLAGLAWIVWKLAKMHSNLRANSRSTRATRRKVVEMDQRQIQMTEEIKKAINHPGVCDAHRTQLAVSNENLLTRVAALEEANKQRQPQ